MVYFWRSLLSSPKLRDVLFIVLNVSYFTVQIVYMPSNQCNRVLKAFAEHFLGYIPSAHVCTGNSKNEIFSLYILCLLASYDTGISSVLHFPFVGTFLGL